MKLPLSASSHQNMMQEMRTEHGFPVSCSKHTALAICSWCQCLLSDTQNTGRKCSVFACTRLHGTVVLCDPVAMRF